MSNGSFKGINVAKGNADPKNIDNISHRIAFLKKVVLVMTD